MDKKQIYEAFAEQAGQRPLSVAEALSDSPEDLDAAAAEVAACREALNFPESGAEAPADDEVFAEDLRQELSGKRFPELTAVLRHFAAGLAEHPALARRIRITPELCLETVAQDFALGVLIAEADRLYHGARDTWMLLSATALGLGQRVLGHVRHVLLRGPGADPAAHSDLQHLLGRFTTEEITPDDPTGTTRTALEELARSYLAARKRRDP